MTEARHDQAVALLTASSPTIVLLVEREGAEQPSEGDSPMVPRVRAHSPPPPPSQGDSPPEETPPLPRNHLPKGLEDQYPIEVSLAAGLRSGPSPGWVETLGGVTWGRMLLQGPAVSSGLGEALGSPCRLGTRPQGGSQAPRCLVWSGLARWLSAPLTVLFAPGRRSTWSRQEARWGSASSGAATTPVTRSGSMNQVSLFQR